MNPARNRGRRWSLEDLVHAQLRMERVSVNVEDPLGTQAIITDEARAVEKAKKRAERERLENKLEADLALAGVMHLFVKQYHLHDPWKVIEKRRVPERLDFYCDRYKLALEVHGGIFTGGRHTRGTGFVKDRRKINAAIAQGISVAEFTPEDITGGKKYAVLWTLKELERRGWKPSA